MNEIVADLRCGLRSWRRTRLLAAAVVLTLGLGVGASTASFSLADALYFRALPFQEPRRLVAVWQETPNGDSLSASWPDLVGWQQRGDLFESVAGYTVEPGGVLASSDGTSLGIVSQFDATRELFTALGVRPLVGRGFASDEHLPWPEPYTGAVVPGLVSHDLWRTRLGAAPDVLGRTLVVGRQRVAIVGVMPPGFRLQRDGRPEVYVPFQGYADWRLPAQRPRRLFEVVARLRPGVPAEAAGAALRASAASTSAGPRLVRVEGLHEHLLGTRRPVLVVLLATAGLLLLVGCANVATLLLARAADRVGEIAVRSALGATRARLARLFVAESAVLAVPGALVGGGLAALVLSQLGSFTGAAEIGLPEVRLDATALGVAFAVALAGAAIFGSAPLLALGGATARRALTGGRGDVRGAMGRRSAHALVAIEVALSLVLLVGAGLLTTSLHRLARVPTGMSATNVVTMSIGSVVTFDPAEFRDRYGTFWPRLLEEMKSQPRVEAVALCSEFPLSAAETSPGLARARARDRNRPAPEAPATIEGVELPPPGHVLVQEGWGVSGGYFQAFGIPLLRGRTFEDHEADGAAVVIVNESFAREQWPGADPVGRRIAVRGRWQTIVGVVGDVRQNGLMTDAPKRLVYSPVSFRSFEKQPGRFLVVRSSMGAAATAATVRSVLRRLDPERSLGRVRTLQQAALGHTAWERLSATVVAALGGLAVLVTLFGLFAVVSRTVATRVREIGIRMALGSQSSGVVRHVMARGVAAVVVGLSSGLGVAAAGSRLLASQLFGVTPHDPVVYAGASGLLLLVAVAACWLPARRAAQVDPIAALRCE